MYYKIKTLSISSRIRKKNFNIGKRPTDGSAKISFAKEKAGNTHPCARCGRPVKKGTPRLSIMSASAYPVNICPDCQKELARFLEDNTTVPCDGIFVTE